MINLVLWHETLSLCSHHPWLTASHEDLSSIFSHNQKKTPAPGLHVENLASYLVENGEHLVLITLTYFWQLLATTASDSRTQQTHSFNPDFRF